MGEIGASTNPLLIDAAVRNRYTVPVLIDAIVRVLGPDHPHITLLAELARPAHSTPSPTKSSHARWRPSRQ